MAISSVGLRTIAISANHYPSSTPRAVRYSDAQRMIGMRAGQFQRVAAASTQWPLVQRQP